MYVYNGIINHREAVQQKYFFAAPKLKEIVLNSKKFAVYILPRITQHWYSIHC